MVLVTCPFDNTETTWAALRLAGQLREWSVRTFMFSWPRQPSGTIWDRFAFVGPKRLMDICGRLQAVIRFECEPAITSIFKHVKEQRRPFPSIAVPSWHRLRSEDIALLATQNAVVCPSRHMPANLYRQFGKGTGLPGLTTWINFDAGLEPVKRDGFLSDGGTLRLAILCDRSTLSAWSTSVLETADIIVRQTDHVEVTLASSLSWQRDDRRYLRELRQLHGRRLQSVRVRQLYDYDQLFHDHDWVLFPWPKADFAWLAVRAMCCGAGVIVPGVPPFSELVHDGTNGAVMACDVYESRYGTLRSRTAPSSWLPRLLALLEPRWLLSLQGRNWMLDSLSRQFCEGWKTLLTSAGVFVEPS